MNDQGVFSDMIQAGEDLEAMENGTLQNEEQEPVTEKPVQEPTEPVQEPTEPASDLLEALTQEPATEQQGEGEPEPSGTDKRIAELAEENRRLKESQDRLVEKVLEAKPGVQDPPNPDDDQGVPFDGYDPSVADYLKQYVDHLTGGKFQQIEETLQPVTEREHEDRLAGVLTESIEGFKPEMMGQVKTYFEGLPDADRPTYAGSDGAAIGLVYKMMAEGKLSLTGEQQPAGTPSRPKPAVHTETGTQPMQQGSGPDEGKIMKSIDKMGDREWRELNRKIDNDEVDVRQLFGG